MIAISHTVRLGVALATAAALAACGSNDAEAAQDGAEEHHAHSAPHDGVLIELGDHIANVEVLLDSETGTLTVYGLGAHAENPERSPTESLNVSLDNHGDAPIEVTLAANVSDLSGEKAGDSSMFQAQSDELKGVDHCHGVIAEITLKGVKYEGLKFDWPPVHDHDEDGHDHGEDGDGHDEDGDDHGDDHDHEDGEDH